MKAYPELNCPMGHLIVERIGSRRYVARWAEDEIGLPGWMIIGELKE